jgi:hypothetical protein
MCGTVIRPGAGAGTSCHEAPLTTTAHPATEPESKLMNARGWLEWFNDHGVVFMLVFLAGVILLGVWCWRGIHEEARTAHGRSSGLWSALNIPGRRVGGMAIAIAGLLVFMHAASEIPGQRRIYNRLLHHGVEVQASVMNIDGHSRGHLHARHVTVRYPAGGQIIQRRIPVPWGDKYVANLRQGNAVKVTYDTREPSVSRLSEDAEDGGLFSSFFVCLISIVAIAGGGYVARRTAWGGSAK